VLNRPLLAYVNGVMEASPAVVGPGYPAAPPAGSGGARLPGVPMVDVARTLHPSTRMRIPIVNRKGGVAKSTTTINLGAALAQASQLGIARRDYRTLIIDMDPQASTSFALSRGAEDEGPNLGSILMEGMHIEDAILPTSTPNLYHISACEALGDEDELVRLSRVDGFRTRLRDALAMLETPFDVVLFDCPPGIGLPMTLAMIAGDRFIIPTKLERFSLHGTGRLFRFMERLIALRENSAEPMADILGVLLTDLNYQFVDAAEREAEIRADSGSAVFDTVIRRNVTIERAQDHFHTIFQEDPRLRSTGAQCYRDLGAEVLLRGIGWSAVQPADLSEDVQLRGARLGLLPAPHPAAA
jgi:chromosome partitioning protein